MKKLLQKGFTLIELLIVIGILGILVVAVLLTLNPGESQRKARDTQRLKDLATLTTVMEQAINDNVINSTSWGATALKNSSAASASTSCSAGWLGVDVCQYVQKLPTDPLNKATRVAGNDTTCTVGSSSTTSNTNAYYYVNYTAASNSYEVNVRLESTTNCGKITGDGGDSFKAVESGSDLTLIGAAN